MPTPAQSSQPARFRIPLRHLRGPTSSHRPPSHGFRFPPSGMPWQAGTGVPAMQPMQRTRCASSLLTLPTTFGWLPWRPATALWTAALSATSSSSRRSATRARPPAAPSATALTGPMLPSPTPKSPAAHRAPLGPLGLAPLARRAPQPPSSRPMRWSSSLPPQRQLWWRPPLRPLPPRQPRSLPPPRPPPRCRAASACTAPRCCSSSWPPPAAAAANRARSWCSTCSPSRRSLSPSASARTTEAPRPPSAPTSSAM
mmetsp:Transcript_3568/g.10252  ORF Transcript_3568/g.10252 Transcript_3568/m.10252 type:complete len:256 (-) Transcript_3568:781-1548(-)